MAKINKDNYAYILEKMKDDALEKVIQKGLDFDNINFLMPLMRKAQEVKVERLKTLSELKTLPMDKIISELRRICKEIRKADDKILTNFYDQKGINKTVDDVCFAEYKKKKITFKTPDKCEVQMRGQVEVNDDIIHLSDNVVIYHDKIIVTDEDGDARVYDYSQQQEIMKKFLKKNVGFKIAS